jgi:hypothetical protein
MLDDQNVMGVLACDEQPGAVAPGMHCIGGDHAPGQVQVLQQRANRTSRHYARPWSAPGRLGRFSLHRCERARCPVDKTA